MRIGIDIDGVCYQWTKTARYMLREILPNSPYAKSGAMGVEDPCWDHIPKNIDPVHWKWLWKEGVENGLFRHGDLYAGTVKALKKLATLGRLVAITQRPHRAAQDTFDWIGYHRLPFKEVHVLHGESKTTVARCDVYIDDKPENCAELHDRWEGLRPVTICIPDRTWNQDFDAEAHGCLRIRSWGAFIAIVQTVKECK